jgi:hypothetical protein
MEQRRQRLVFATITILFSFCGSIALLLAADLYTHHKFDTAAGLNWRGYRGPVVGRKRAANIASSRLGGSTVLGDGLPWSEAFPAYIERDLRAAVASASDRSRRAPELESCTRATCRSASPLRCRSTKAGR